MGSHSRRRSLSSSSSSSSSSDEDKKSKKKNGKHGKHGAPVGFPEPSSHGMPPPYGAHTPHPTMPAFPIPGGHDMPQIPVPGVHDAHSVSRGNEPTLGGHFPSPGGAPPGGQTPPPSGFRIPLTDAAPFPTQQAGPPAVYDADGRTPVYIGSALFEKAVHPCKIVPSFTPPARVAYGGRELEHQGRYDLLPFDPTTMEWVPTSHGQIPQGRRPVEGGYEENGGKLYHALATVNGVRVPGKTGTHLNGANVPFGGQEHVVSDYAILCWRF